MGELISLLEDGLHTWRRNLRLCVPHILEFVFVYAFSILYIVVVLMLVFLAGYAFFPGLNLQEGLSQEMISSYTGLLLVAVLVLLALLIFYLLVTVLISSFFTAGAVGISGEALTKGETTLSAMLIYGRKKALSLFALNLFIYLVYLVAGLVLLGLFIGLPHLMGYSLGEGGLLIISFQVIGLIVSVICFILLTLLFAPVQYAIVLSNLGFKDGLRKGIYFFMENRISVFALSFITCVLTVLFEIINQLCQFITEYLPPVVDLMMYLAWLFIYVAVLTCILAPLYTLWWSRLYLSKT
ncbi:MAG: hypothetical protein B6U97_04610 [Candidatus Altiarchaeales archaeon ex4484_96]|nr:MAG: hypothetical protein B6U97_04610 [Candidatus Altiarchaeales archaeon ex4484_96]